MKKLTIIIPSYNTEHYIDKNMKTFIDERLFKPVEIIIVNDGSKDHTTHKAQAYEDMYPGYVRVINKENGGHGSAINRGIKEATGKYIKIVDADDWVDTENLVHLVDILSSTDVDAVVNPYIKVHQQTGHTLICGALKKWDNRAISFENLMKSNYKIVLHSGTYKTDLFRKHGIKVTEKCFYEDFQYTFFLIPFIDSVLYDDHPVYYYLVGQKMQSVNAASGFKNIEMYKKVLFDSLDYYENIRSSIDDVTKTYMDNCLSDFIRSMYNIFLRNGNMNNAENKMRVSDTELKRQSMYFYRLVAKNNKYISLLRWGGTITFKVISKAFCFYKRNEVF